MAYIGVKPTIGNFQICDAISVVNGQAAYTMQVGGVNVSPQSASHMIVSLNGTIQKPNSSYTVANSVITFSSNLATGDVIDFIQILGDVLDLGVPSDATVTTAKLADSSVSLAKLTATGTKNTTTFLRGDNTFDVPPLGGITEADMFRLTADTANGTNGDISANLERVDDATFSKIGTGMTENSGIFSFPSSGLYEVTANPMILANADTNAYVNGNVSSDSGSTYDEVLVVNNGDNGGQTTTSGTQSTLVNVTNASTFRVKFKTDNFVSITRVLGSTSANVTTFKFIRLGSSQ
jgi:hypothetical protein